MAKPHTCTLANFLISFGWFFVSFSTNQGTGNLVQFPFDVFSPSQTNCGFWMARERRTTTEMTRMKSNLYWVVRVGHISLLSAGACDQMFKTLVNRADTNLFRHLDYLLIRHCGASHILDRKCISHDTLIISYTSKCDQHCLSANNTDWNIHLRVNKIVTKVKVTAVTRPGNISDKCFTLV